MSNEEEVIDETIEETQEEVTETPDETPTLEDYQKLLKEKQTLQAQKEHWKKKATAPKEETNTPNTPSGLTREEAILFAKGLTEEEVDLASRLAKVNGVSLVKATEDPYFQSKLEERLSAERSKKAQLGASSGGIKSSEKPIEAMTDEEHRAYYEKTVAGL